ATPSTSLLSLHDALPICYDDKSRPDLSNTQFFIDSLIAAGVSKDDPAIQRALKFVGRCQNLADKEKGNDQEFATKAKEDDKGGLDRKSTRLNSSHVAISY